MDGCIPYDTKYATAHPASDSYNARTCTRTSPSSVLTQAPSQLLKQGRAVLPVPRMQEIHS